MDKGFERYLDAIPCQSSVKEEARAIYSQLSRERNYLLKDYSIKYSQKKTVPTVRISFQHFSYQHWLESQHTESLFLNAIKKGIPPEKIEIFNGLRRRVSYHFNQKNHFLLLPGWSMDFSGEGSVLLYGVMIQRLHPSWKIAPNAGDTSCVINELLRPIGSFDGPIPLHASFGVELTPQGVICRFYYPIFNQDHFKVGSHHLYESISFDQAGKVLKKKQYLKIIRGVKLSVILQDKQLNNLLQKHAPENFFEREKLIYLFGIEDNAVTLYFRE